MSKEKIDKSKKDEIPDRVIARSYPSTIYLWPAVLVGYLIYLLSWLNKSFNFVSSTDQPKFHSLLAGIWLTIVIFNLIVMSFDFSLGKTFTIFISFGFLVLLYIVIRDGLNIKVALLPSIAEFLADLSIEINPNFYLLFSLLMTFIYIIVFIQTRFNYWEFTSNRISRRGGFFEREESFSAQSSRVVTETTDVFERLLFRAGVIYVIEGDKKVHQINNVYNAIGIDNKIQDMLSVINIRDTTE